MIIGHMKEAAGGFSRYAPAIREALEFLQQQDFRHMEDGKYPIHGEDSYAVLQRYETRVPESGKPEAHRRYIDIQYIVEGREQLGWSPLSHELQVHTPYDAEKDLIFFEHLFPEVYTTLSEGVFAILYPEDVHRPCGSLGQEPEKVTKVVVKIAVDYADR